MINKTKLITTDLPERKEERYILLSDDILSFISKRLERKKFSNNEVVQTIYFSNDTHTLPFLLTLKARRYLPSKDEKFNSLYAGKWFFDVKERRDDKKYKSRTEATLDEIIDFVNKEYCFDSEPLRPFFLLEYNRVNYIYTDEKEAYARFSFDTDVNYFYFENKDNSIQQLCTEPYLRLEVKSKSQSERLESFIASIIQEFNAIPVISKKGQAYNSLCQYLYRKDNINFIKELKDVEIESKLETRSDKIFPLIFESFKAGKFFYKIPDHFPHVFESSSLNRYYQNEKGGYKLMLRPDSMSIIKKGMQEICQNSENLHSILKRSEFKERFKSIKPELFSKDKLVGELYRYRKAFWIQNPETKRLYHISLDICLTYSKNLYEVEVEYSGKYADQLDNPTEIEQVIVDEIAKITKIILSLSNELTESTLTKQEWLLKQSDRDGSE